MRTNFNLKTFAFFAFATAFTACGSERASSDQKSKKTNFEVINRDNGSTASVYEENVLVQEFHNGKNGSSVEVIYKNGGALVEKTFERTSYSTRLKETYLNDVLIKESVSDYHNGKIFERMRDSNGEILQETFWGVVDGRKNQRLIDIFYEGGKPVRKSFGDHEIYDGSRDIDRHASDLPSSPAQP